MANWLLPVMALKNLINYVSNTFIGIPAESNRLALCNRINARDISRPLRAPFAGPHPIKSSNDNRYDLHFIQHFRSPRSKRFQSSRRSRRTRAETLATQADTSEVKLAKI